MQSPTDAVELTSQQAESETSEQPDVAGGTASSSRTYLASVIVALAALVVSLAWSWKPSVWTDEGATIAATSRSLTELVALITKIDAVHATYYALMHGWFEVVPVNVWTLRAPSAVAVALTAGLLVELVRRLGSLRLAVTSGVVFALLPRTTWMGAEGRSSALATLLAVAATLLLLAWIQRRGAPLLLLYGAAVCAGIWVNIYVVFLLPAHLVAVLALVVRGRRLLSWLATSAVACCLALPIVTLAKSQSAQIGGGEPLDLLRWARQLVVNQVYLGETPGGAPLTGPASFWVIASLGAALIGWGLTGLGIWSHLRSRRQSSRALVLLAVTWLVLPSVLVAVWSLVSGSSMYNPRYFAFCAPAAAILIGAGLNNLRERWIRTLVGLLLIMCLLPVYASQRVINAKQGADWSQVAAHIAAEAAVGDGVYFSPRPTTRTIAVAYPAAFERLTDITLLRSGPDDGSLAGESKPLADVLRSPQPPTVWGIWKADHDSELEADLTLFRAVGYRPVSVWRGPVDEVVELKRS